MGCKECKSKQNSDTVTVPLMPDAMGNGDFNGNFLYKVVAFIAIIAVLPVLVIILLGQMFLTFFMPKSKLDLSSKFVKFFENIIKWYAKRKGLKELRRREEEFSKTTNYDGEDDYEVYQTEEYTTEEILEDAETLDWENLSNPKVKKGNNKKGQ